MATGSETITIQGEQARDNHGDPVGDAPEPVQVEQCVIWPRTSVEEGRGEVIIDGLNVFIPPGSPAIPGPKDVVVARGDAYAVDGRPGEYINKAGDDKGTIVVLTRRTT